MALIAMAVYSTKENRKHDLIVRSIESLVNTVDLSKHELYICANACTRETHHYLMRFQAKYVTNVTVIFMGQNLGTAKAINQAWQFRKEGQHCIKMDDDIVIHEKGWVDRLEEAIERDPLIGQVGLKRKDCWETPWHEHSDWRSELKMLPHQPGEPWLIVEKVKHVIGSCVMHSSALLDKVGYLYQPSLYGYDDVIMSHRTHLAGFYSCFLPHINIDHIDPGDTPYQDWKQKHSGEQTQKVIDLVHEMYNGTKPIYYDL